MKIIGLMGNARVGKDTVGNYLGDKYWSTLYAFADPIKDMLEPVFGDLFREGDRESPIPWLGQSPRWLMQTLGTDWGREMIHPDLWVRIAGRVVLRSKVGVFTFTDVRFANEAEMIRNFGGDVWHITRPDAPAVNKHKSEDLPAYLATHTIANDGSVIDLFRKVDKLMGEA